MTFEHMAATIRIGAKAENIGRPMTACLVVQDCLLACRDKPDRLTQIILGPGQEDRTSRPRPLPILWPELAMFVFAAGQTVMQDCHNGCFRKICCAQYIHACQLLSPDLGTKKAHSTF